MPYFFMGIGLYLLTEVQQSRWNIKWEINLLWNRSGWRVRYYIITICLFSQICNQHRAFSELKLSQASNKTNFACCDCWFFVAAPKPLTLEIRCTVSWV